MKIFQSEKEKALLEESIQVGETLEDEDLAEPEEEVDENEALKAIKNQKDVLNRRITLGMYKASDPSEKKSSTKKRSRRESCTT